MKNTLLIVETVINKKTLSTTTTTDVVGQSYFEYHYGLKMPESNSPVKKTYDEGETVKVTMICTV
jgi:hypothetical protein